MCVCVCVVCVCVGTAFELRDVAVGLNLANWC